AKASVREELWQREKGCGLGLFYKDPESISEDMFKSWTPGISPEFVEDAHDLRDDKAPFFGVRAIKEVQADDMFAVSGIERDHVVLAPAGDVLRQKRFINPTVRIDDCDTGPGRQVSCSTIRKECAFAGSRATKRRKMFLASFGRNAKTRLAEETVRVGADRSRGEH